MMIKVGQKLISELVEINSFLVISEALNFKVFQGNMPLDPSTETRAFGACCATCELAPSKENMLCAQIQNHDSFCEQCFMCNLNQGCQKNAVGTRSKLHKKYLFHSYQYLMVLTP